MTNRRDTDALELLEADHRRIEQLFARLAAGPAQAGTARREWLAEEACLELLVRSRLEQELLLPAAREALGDDDLIDESEAGNERLRDMVAQVLATRIDHPLHEPRLAVLRDYALRHIRHERDVLFPRLRQSPLDRGALGRSIAVRREELKSVADALREDLLAAAL